MRIEFRLLGPVEVRAAGRAVAIGPARHQGVLAALLCDANRSVSVDQLVDRVWGGRRLPKQPRNTVHTYISLLKRSLADVAGAMIVRQSYGYMIEIDEELLDLHRFRALIKKARSGDGGVPDLFEHAFALWRGQALATLDTPWAEGVRRTLEAERLTAESDLTDLRLALGQHGALVASLIERCAANPLDERLAGQLMLALFRNGRQADALHHYHRIRRQLAEDLGTEPGHPLQQLYHQVLMDDPALVVAPLPAAVARGHATTHAATPRQLPANVRGFVGRRDQLDRLDALLDATRRGEPGNGAIATVSGLAGSGKTALAVHWAHRVADRFPDGQFYANLRGFDERGHAVLPGRPIRDFLDAMGVPASRIPTSLEARAALYRSMLTGKRVLVVLDNARDSDQIRALLPGAATVFTLVTSRDRLTSLIATNGAQPLGVNLLTRDEARELLARRLGAGQTAAHAEAVQEIITACAGLPLALTIMAARAEQTGFPLDALAAEVRAACRRLDAFDGGDPATQLRAVLSWSYATLSPPAARLFRLLGAGPGTEISAVEATDLAAVSLREARRLFGELTRASLLIERAPGQYTCHELPLAYAKELLDADDTDADTDTDDADTDTDTDTDDTDDGFGVGRGVGFGAHQKSLRGRIPGFR